MRVKRRLWKIGRQRVCNQQPPTGTWWRMNFTQKGDEPQGKAGKEGMKSSRVVNMCHVNSIRTSIYCTKRTMMSRLIRDHSQKRTPAREPRTRLGWHPPFRAQLPPPGYTHSSAIPPLGPCPRTVIEEGLQAHNEWTRTGTVRGGRTARRGRVSSGPASRLPASLSPAFLFFPLCYVSLNITWYIKYDISI